MSPKIIPRISRAISAQHEADGLPAARFQARQIQGERTIRPQFLPRPRPGRRTALLPHLLPRKAKCSNSCRGAYAESTSGRRPSWPYSWLFSSRSPLRLSMRSCSTYGGAGVAAPQGSRHQLGGAHGPYERGRPWRPGRPRRQPRWRDPPAVPTAAGPAPAPDDPHASRARARLAFSS